MQTIIPYLQYDDAPAAIAFLCAAFGFTEAMRYPMPDGTVGHAELAMGDDRVYLASVWREGGFAPAGELPGLHSQLFVRVDDVDAHFARARAAGATIAAEPHEEHGQRMYRALDCEGQRWVFFRETARA
jgi:uncharacterized glyoxalase superfamily protein PhnB